MSTVYQEEFPRPVTPPDVNQELAVVLSSPELTPMTNASEVLRLYEDRLVESERLLYPTSTEQAQLAQSQLLEELAAAKLAGRHIAIVDGAFDVPHDNHTWYLREARLRAARAFFKDGYDGARLAERRQMVASPDICLIVTLDADAKIAQKKGFRPEKGNIARPVYPWDARANRIGGFTVPNGFGTHSPVLDLITVEGDPNHVGTMFESHLEFGRTLIDYGLLDTWVIFDEHEATVEAAAAIAGDYAPEVISVVAQDESRYAVDARTGKTWSSSGIIKAIKGDI